MNLSAEFWLQIAVFLVSFIFSSGIVWTKLRYIERKQDKHNRMIERMYRLEESNHSAHHRIDELRKDLINCNGFTINKRHNETN